MSDFLSEVYSELLREGRESARRVVEVPIFDISLMLPAAAGLTARGFVEELLDHVTSVPDRFRDQIKFDFRSDGFGGIEECRAYYKRPETDAELESRRQEATARAETLIAQGARIAENRAAADRREYERLKAIFEPAAPDTVAQL